MKVKIGMKVDKYMYEKEYTYTSHYSKTYGRNR
jgi:hypothetical protein